MVCGFEVILVSLEGLAGEVPLFVEEHQTHFLRV